MGAGKGTFAKVVKDDFIMITLNVRKSITSQVKSHEEVGSFSSDR